MRKGEYGNLRSGLLGFAGIVLLAALWVTVSGPIYKKVAGRNRPISEVAIFVPGTYEGTARGYGGPVTVSIKVSEYEIEDVKIKAPDETPEIGMAAAEKVSKEIWLTQSHSVDSVSGATMTSNAIKKALAEAFRGAAKEGTELADIIAREISDENEQRSLPEISEILQDVPDGAYQYQDESDDGNGYYNVMEVSVKDKRLTAIRWDMVDSAGVTKRGLSADGQYVMTENGPRWDEQADMLAEYVLQYQTTVNLADDAGTTDALVSVSIHVGGFVDSLKKCLLLAKGDVSQFSIPQLVSEREDGAYLYVSETMDENGFRDQIKMVIEDHKITSLEWDAVKDDGTGKRKLSADGQYVMREDGPRWEEQADELARYVTEHQSEEGLLDESGYGSDAVASVSIYAGGFVEAVKKCLVQGEKQ